MGREDAGEPWDQSGAGWSVATPTPPPADASATGPATRYQDGALLGQGGMGRVVMAHDPVLARDVALKRVRPGASADAAARLLHEARVGASLEHPGIVPVYDAGTDADGAPWVAMRVVRGRTLEAILGDAPDVAARLGLVRRLHAIAEAVAYAHQRGVVHGDLKPANVMFGEHGEAQVLDWGLARDAPDGDHPDAHRSPIGTPAYMSPEQAGLLAAPVGAATDVWSLGAMLFELLSGRRLIAGRGDSALTELAAGPPDLAPLAAGPAELAAITRRALAWRPEDRYPSADALARDLGHFLDGRLVDAHPYSLLDHLRRFVRRFRVPLAVAALGLVALVIAIARGQAREDAQRAHLFGELAAERALAGDRVGAARLALDALELGPSPKARGALAATLAGAAPTLSAELTLPPGCGAFALSPDARSLACHDGPTLTVYDFPASVADLSPMQSAAADGQRPTTFRDFPDLTPRWHRDVGSAAGVGVADGWLVAAPILGAADGRRHPGDVLALADGSVLRAVDVEARSSPRRFGAATVLQRSTHGAVVYRGDAPSLEENAWCDSENAVAVAASADGARLAVGCGDDGVWVVPRQRSLPAPGAAPDGLRSGPPGAAEAQAASHTARIGAGAAPERVIVGLEPGDWATALAFDDGGGLLVGSRTGRVWRAAASGVAETQPAALGDGPIAALVPAGGHALVATDNGLWLWQVGAGVPERLPASERTPLGFERLPPGTSGEVAGDASLALWTSDGARAQRWRLPAPRGGRLAAVGGLSALATADSGEVIVGDGAGCLSVYAATGELRGRACAPGEVMKTAGYLPRARRAVGERVGSSTLLVLDVASGARLSDIPLPTSLRRLVVLADDTIYAQSFGTTVLQVRDGVVTAIPGGAGMGLDLAAAPDQTWAANLDTTGAVSVVRAGAVQQAFVAPGAGVVAAADDGTFVIGVRERLERRGADGTLLAQAQLRSALDDAAVDARGRIATGHRDGTVRVWTPSLELVSELRGHRERASLVAFAPSGELWSAGWDAVVRRWDTTVVDAAPEALRERVEGHWGAAPEP